MDAITQKPTLSEASKNAIQHLIQSFTPLLPEPETSPLFFDGTAAHSEGRVEDAERAYRSFLSDNSDHPGALFSLGICRLQQGAVGEGLDNIVSAVDQFPESAVNLFHCGMVLGSFGRPQQQIEKFFASLAAAPNAQVEMALSQTLDVVGQTMEALYHCDRAISLDETLGLAWSFRGSILVELGRLTAAQRAFEKAVDMIPGKAQACLGLAEMGAIAPDSPAFDALCHSSEGDKAETSDRWIMYFARGAAFERAGQHRQALECYIIGNSLRRPNTSYDESEFMTSVQKARDTFSRAALSRECGEQSPLPVFIVGMPRSGSTLIEQILSSHPSVFGAGEVNDWTNALCLNDVHSLDKLLTLTDQELNHIGHDYVFMLRRYCNGARRVVNKMLSNYLSIGAIRSALPKASIIHARRNPLDTCVSCFSKVFPIAFSYDLSELGRYYKAYDSLMMYWHEVLPEGAILDVSYEALVEDFEPQARRILEFCGLDWDERCLKFYENRRIVRTVSGTQVRKPIYGSAIGRWHECADILRPLIDALGPDLAV